MTHNEKYLVLEDVVYSTTHILIELMAKVYMKYYENAELLEVADDETLDNFMVITHILNMIYADERPYSKDSLFNVAMSRPVDDYVSVSPELLDWLLDQFDSLDDVIVRISPIIALVGTPEIICVYQPANKLENLAIRKLGINNCTDKKSLIDDVEFFKQLEELKSENKDDRPSILTASQVILDKYGKDFPILAPVNFPWIAKNSVGVVEAWSFDRFVKKNEENEEEKKENEENGNES